MKIYENVTKTVYVCTKIVCDICHKDFDEWSVYNDLKIDLMFRYGSEKDLRVYTANYCQECALHKVIPALQAIGDIREEEYGII